MSETVETRRNDPKEKKQTLSVAGKKNRHHKNEAKTHLEKQRKRYGDVVYLNAQSNQSCKFFSRRADIDGSR